MNSKEFTFSIMAYKHRKYIISHLFSIKNLIEKYGLEWENYLLVLDDASQDGTVDVIKRWLEENSLFKDVKIIENSQNQGIVQNFIQMNKHVHTRYFKSLSADDLYYKNNIYRCAEKGGLTLTPTIRFRNKCILNETIWGNYKMMARRKDLRKAMLNQFKECWIIETPGAFYDICYVTDAMLENLKEYNYVEDVIFYYSLIHGSNIEISFDPTSYVLYRMGGISTTKTVSNPVKKYNEEVDYLNKTIFTKRKKMSSGVFNFYRCYQSIRWRYYEYFLPLINSELRQYEKNRKAELMEAQKHLESIQNLAEEWEKSHEF